MMLVNLAFHKDGSWSRVQVRGGPYRFRTRAEFRSEGAVFDRNDHPLESGPMTQAGFDASKPTLSCGADRSRE
jgi:hypothetical protein